MDYSSAFVTSRRRERGIMARCAPVLVLLLSLLVCSSRTAQQFAGYTNITFTSVPTDKYTVISRITTFPCRATGVSQSTNLTQELDVIFYRNQLPLTNKYNPYQRHYYLNSDGVTSDGLLIHPTELEDNGVSFYCQVMIGNSLINVTSPLAVLTVADGRPGAILLSLVSRTIQSTTVEWAPLLLPEGGDILYYKAYLFDSSNQLINVTNITTGMLGESRSYQFTGLTPDTGYKARIVGVNSFGLGNESSMFDFRTLQSLQAPSPSSISFNMQSNGNLLVYWEAPTISDYSTTYPIIHFSLQYSLNGGTPTVLNTTDNATLSLELSGLTPLEEYTFRLTSFNKGSGSPNFVTGTYRIVPSVEPSSSSSESTHHSTTLVTSSSTALTSTVLSSTHLTTPTTLSSTQLITTTNVAFITSSTSTLTSSSTHLTTPTSSFTTQSVTTPTTTLIATPTSATPIEATHTSYSSSTSSSTIVTQSSSTTSITISVVSSTTPVIRPSVLDQSDESPIGSNVIVLAIAAIAAVILIAIITIAVVMVGFCLYTTRRKNDGVDLTDGPSTWPERRPSNMKKYGSKDSSIKGSSLSGSVSHSLSSDQDLPSFHHNGAINHHTYSNVPSDSPGSIKNERDLGSIEELSTEGVVVVDVEEYSDGICTEV